MLSIFYAFNPCFLSKFLHCSHCVPLEAFQYLTWQCILSHESLRSFNFFYSVGIMIKFNFYYFLFFPPQKLLVILLDLRMNDEGRERKKFKREPGLFYSLSESIKPVKKVIELWKLLSKQLSITHLKAIQYIGKWEPV